MNNDECNSSSDKGKKYLLVFDFDRTIIDDNTDGVVIQMLERLTGCSHPQVEGDGWSTTMSNALKHLQQLKVRCVCVCVCMCVCHFVCV